MAVNPPKRQIPKHRQLRNWMVYKLRDIAQKGRVSSLDVPDLDDIADAIELHLQPDSERPEDDLPRWDA